MRSRDRGPQYRTGMYFHSEAQEAEARLAFEREASGWKSSGRPVVTELRPAGIFWPAEEEHQRFLEKGNGRSGKPQSAEKGTGEEIRCYGCLQYIKKRCCPPSSAHSQPTRRANRRRLQ